MRLIQMKIKNFRCYNDETVVDLDKLVVFVGKNDSGKSSLFDALEIFFEGKAAPDKDDACVHASDATVRITCVFDDIPAQLVIDAQHPTDLTSEYLLNGNGHLEIVKEYNCGLAKPKCSAVYARCSHPTADGYSDLLSLTNTKLKQRANTLGVDLEGINQTINTEIRRAIWQQTDALQCQDIDIELKTEAAKEIWDQLKRHLPVYALFKSDRPSTDQDSEAQDPMKAAVKEAIKAEEDNLNLITQKVKAEVQEIANRTVEKLREMNPALASQLTPRVSNKNWDTLFSVDLTGDEDIPINKRGSGTRRLVLLNFFRARSEKEAEDKSTGVIYAIEEPETSQHPNNQVMLVRALEELSDRSGCQVMLSTHTPVLARRFNQNSLRLVTRDNGIPVIRSGCQEQTIREIVESLGVLPDHNVRAFFGVEGRHDINFLRAISRILHAAGENILDLGCEEDLGRLVFVPLGGSSLDLWVSRLKGFNRPEFYLMDRDNQPPDKPKYHTIAAELAQRENCTVWITERKELENYLHPQVINSDYSDYAGKGADFEDVPMLFAQAVHETSERGVPWADVCSDVKKLSKKESNAKRRLNSEYVAKMTPDLLTEIDTQNELRKWLQLVSHALSTDEERE
ncbi:MAG TPA: ATP-binding protein [Thermoanaerobaculia bacterium]|nr:ATP-binding protein [Thermoanaerobaculia bacterium]HUM31107.1 ATP-binding protein [Thermoanaerobaculia bacterium]HXK69463.1 ATP-binding protein [Thermoanaerobaculia bacterium]